MTTKPTRYEPTLLERVVGYWAGATSLVAVVMVAVSLSRAVSATF